MRAIQSTSALRSLIAICLLACQAFAQGSLPPYKLDAKHLPNPIVVRQGLISGGLPESEDAFKELQQLGVKTIISVDGVKPDVQMAQKYSMRYVHIPHGYDGIPNATLESLTKAISELPSPIYIHCHHGKHRSPTAAAAACVAQGSLNAQEALGILELAGTNPSYKGLFLTVQKAKRLDQAQLAKLHVDFPSVCDVTPLVEAMVALDETFAKLNKVAMAGWKPLSESLQVDCQHEAVLLREHFEEMLRLEEIATYPSEFRHMLEESERSAWFIESMLAFSNDPNLGKIKPDQRDALDVNWKSIRTNCSACHQRFRDQPK